MRILKYLLIIFFSLSFSQKVFSDIRQMEYRCKKVQETGQRGFYRFFDIKLTSNGFYGEVKFFSKKRNKFFIQTFTGDTSFSGHFIINSRYLSEDRKPVSNPGFIKFDKSSLQNINIINYLDKGVLATQGARYCTLRMLPKREDKEKNILQKKANKENELKLLTSKKIEAERKQKELAAKKAEEERKRKELAAKKAEEERKRKELAAKKVEKERKRKELAAKKAEEERKRKELAAKKAEEERKRKELAAKKAEEERKQKQLAAKKAEEERKRKELAAKKAEEERKRKELAVKKAEEERKQKQLAAKKAEEERKRKELAAKKAEEERKRKELAVKKAEEERKQKELAAKKAEEERKRKELAAKKAEEERKRKELAAKKAEEERKQKELAAKKIEYKSISKIFIEDLKDFVKKPNNLDILKVGELLANYNSYQKSSWNFNKVKAFDDIYKYVLNDKNFKRFYNKNNKEREKIILKARKGIIIYLENSLDTIKNYISKNLGTSAANDAILIAKKINNSLKKIDEKGSINLIEEINQWKSLNKIEDGHKLTNEAVELIINIKVKIAEKQKELAAKKAEEERKRKELAAKKAAEERKQKELAAKKTLLAKKQNKKMQTNINIKETFNCISTLNMNELYQLTEMFSKFNKLSEQEDLYKTVAPPNTKCYFSKIEKIKKLEDEVKTSTSKAGHVTFSKKITTTVNGRKVNKVFFYRQVKSSKIVPKILNKNKKKMVLKKDIVNKSKFKTGIEYKNYNGRKCDNTKTSICINNAEYEHLCRRAKNVTVNVRQIAAVMYGGDYKYFIRQDGNFSNLRINFQKPNWCSVSYLISGYFKGDKKGEQISGRAERFVLSKSGKVLVHFVSSF